MRSLLWFLNWNRDYSYSMRFCTTTLMVFRSNVLIHLYFDSSGKIELHRSYSQAILAFMLNCISFVYDLPLLARLVFQGECFFIGSE